MRKLTNNFQTSNTSQTRHDLKGRGLDGGDSRKENGKCHVAASPEVFHKIKTNFPKRL
jgi:hypothetical protein